jgi:hypothetical protein
MLLVELRTKVYFLYIAAKTAFSVCALAYVFSIRLAYRRYP